MRIPYKVLQRVLKKLDNAASTGSTVLSHMDLHKFVENAPVGTPPFDIQKLLSDREQVPPHTWQDANKLRDLMDVREVPVLHYSKSPRDPEGRNAFYITHPWARKIGEELAASGCLTDSTELSKLLKGRAGGVFLGQHMKDVGTLAHELGHARNARYNRQYSEGQLQSREKARQCFQKGVGLGRAGALAVPSAGVAGMLSYFAAKKAGAKTWIKQLFSKGGSKASKLLGAVAGLLAARAGLAATGAASNFIKARRHVKQGNKFLLAQQYTASLHAAKALRKLLLDDEKTKRFTDSNGQALRSYINALQTNVAEIQDKVKDVL